MRWGGCRVNQTTATDDCGSGFSDLISVQGPSSAPVPEWRRERQIPKSGRFRREEKKGKEEFIMKRTEEQPAESRKAPIELKESDLQEEVRRRAYQIYEERGTGQGSAVEDWLRAEAELLDGQPMRKAA